MPWVSHLYAPDAAYSEITGKYYLYFGNGGSNIGPGLLRVRVNESWGSDTKAQKVTRAGALLEEAPPACHTS